MDGYSDQKHGSVFGNVDNGPIGTDSSDQLFKVFQEEMYEDSTHVLTIYYHHIKISVILPKFILINYYVMDQNTNLVE